MTSFASADDMANRTQGLITPVTHPFLNDELEAATDAIQAYCGWHIAARQAVTLIRRFPTCEQVWLPAMNVTEITAAKIDGITFDAEALEAIEFDPLTGWTSISGRAVSLTFNAGLDAVPADLKLLVLEMAAGALGSPLGISREQAGGVSVTLERVGGGLSAEDMQRLTPYKLGRLP